MNIFFAILIFATTWILLGVIAFFLGEKLLDERETTTIKNIREGFPVMCLGPIALVLVAIFFVFERGAELLETLSEKIPDETVVCRWKRKDKNS